MKCKNCSGNYRAADLSCPYCGTPNALGRMWQKEEAAAGKRIDTAKMTAREKMPYVIYRLTKRLMLALVGILALSFVVVMVVFWVTSVIPGMKYKAQLTEVEARVRELWKDGRYEDLDRILDEYDLWDDEHFIYCQACVLYREYENFNEYRLLFETESEEDKAEDDYYLPYSMKEAHELIQMHHFGIYEEIDPANLAQLEGYEQAARIYLTGYLGFTQEELDYWASEYEDFILSDDLDEWTAKILERGAWR